jgi:hypothetical protein
MKEEIEKKKNGKNKEEKGNRKENLYGNVV